MMKTAVIFLFFFFLLTVVSVSAQPSECQYSYNETYFEDELVLAYQDTNVMAGEIPLFSDFSNGTRSSFMVFNPNNFEVVVMLNYSVEGHGGGVKSY